MTHWWQFKRWATPVTHRGWAVAAVALHRLQRMTVWPGGRVHNAINGAEWAAFGRATA